MTERLPRLRAVFDCLPVIGLPPRLLNVGCGDFPCAAMLAAALPGWTIIGVDQDGAALRRVAALDGVLHLVQGDARELATMLHTRFGVVLVRHPDLFRCRVAWITALPDLVKLLVPGGCLVITLYAPEEVELIRALELPPPLWVDETALPRVDLAGRDRYVWVVQR